MENSKLMDVKQVAEYLQMNKMTIYKLVRSGEIPSFKIASEWRFKKEMIDQWLMEKMHGKAAPEESLIALPQGLKVLVVDNELFIREFFQKALTRDGYNVILAANGYDAIAKISQEKPDLVLLDIKMPGIDGIETLRRIKELNKELPVIMLSAYNNLRTSMEAVKLGAYDSLAKPFDLDEIKAIIGNALSEIQQKVTPSSPEKPKRKKPK